MIAASENQIEVFAPGNRFGGGLDVYDWARERGCEAVRSWRMAHPLYPNGIRNTPWDRIVWRYLVRLPDRE